MVLEVPIPIGWKKYRARKKLKLKKDQRRVEALTGRVEELEKQVCLLEDALSLISCISTGGSAPRIQASEASYVTH